MGFDRCNNSDGEVTVSVQTAEWYNGKFSSLRGEDISLIINRLDARGGVYYFSSNEGIDVFHWALQAEVFWDNSTNLGGETKITMRIQMVELLGK